MPETRAELLKMLGAEGMRRFLHVYLSESRRRLNDMVEASLSGDADRVREAVHALLPTSRWVGATQVAELCQTLHSREDWQRVTQEHAELVMRIAELHGAWEAELYHSMPDVTPLPLAGMPIPSMGQLAMPK